MITVEHVKIFTFIAVVGFIVTLFVSVLSAYFPVQMQDFDSETYQADQASLQQFAGDLALYYTPYVLMDVRSPGFAKITFPNPLPSYHIDGDPVGRDRYYVGSPYGQIGVTNPDGVYMDPDQKSSMRLGNNAYGMWTHTGYRYVFAPAVDSARDQQINVIWYKFGNEQGLDAGVDVSFLDKRFWFISATEIVENYDVTKQIGEYKFRLGDRSVYMLLKFNVTALQENGGDYYQTFDQGGWSLNIAKKILADTDDIQPDLIDTVLNIIKMNNPNLPGELNIIIAFLITVPGAIAVVLFIKEMISGWL